MPVITKELFAQWSFERDKELGLLEAESLENYSEKEVYLEEAEMYLTGLSEIGLPEDIIERAKKEGVSIPPELE